MSATRIWVWAQVFEELGLATVLDAAILKSESQIEKHCLCSAPAHVYHICRVSCLESSGHCLLRAMTSLMLYHQTIVPQPGKQHHPFTSKDSSGSPINPIHRHDFAHLAGAR